MVKQHLNIYLVKNMIKITDNADIHLSSIVAENKVAGVKLAVNSGGCSGFTYSMGYTEEEDYNEDKLKKFEQDGITCVIDRASEPFIAGVTVDWHEDLMKRGFVFNNPNATRSCGCGKSFSV